MKTIKKFIVAVLLTTCTITMQAQYCQKPVDTVYSLTAAGQLYPVNINNATAGAAFGSTGTGVNANGLGFSSLNGSFYFFNRCNTGVPGDTTQFVRYIPSTSTTVVLADPPATFTTAQKMRSGCINNGGDGYYTINPAAVGGPALYYYSIGANTWTTITQTFKNKSGGTIADISTLNSGDMAFDGGGNLWMICSSSATYTLYKIKATVPTIVTASIVVDTIIAETTTPAGVSITGIAFNSAGKLYLSTGAGGGAGNNKLYELATSTGVLTLKGTLPAGYGDDLTSCSYPNGVLTVTWVNFTAAFQSDHVQLDWTINEKENTAGYEVEYSTDAVHWNTIGYIEKDISSGAAGKNYQYTHHAFNTGNNYYRIVRVFATGEKETSSTRLVNTRDEHKICIGPNPANDIIYFYNKDNSSKLIAQIFDKTGKLLYSTIVAADQQSIDISRLPGGSFVLRLLSPDRTENPLGYHFIKW